MLIAVSADPVSSVFLSLYLGLVLSDCTIISVPVELAWDFVSLCHFFDCSVVSRQGCVYVCERRGRLHWEQLWVRSRAPTAHCRPLQGHGSELSTTPASAPWSPGRASVQLWEQEGKATAGACRSVSRAWMMLRSSMNSRSVTSHQLRFFASVHLHIGLCE